MLPFRPPLDPMLAKLTRELPLGDLVYEPKWDGFRALVWKDGDEVDVRSRNDRRLARYFPEVCEAVRRLPCPRAVLDGEIVLLANDFAALMSRLHPAETRVARLAEETPAVLVAFDLLALEDEDTRGAPFADRRARLAELVHDSAVRLTPATRSHAEARAWLDTFEGVMAKDPRAPYAPGRRTMVKVKKERTLECVVAGFRVFASPAKVGSLLLGLYDEGERLVHVGVASQLTEARRAELLALLRPRIVPLAGHPWENGFGLAPSPLGRLRGSAGRWTPGEMEPDWIPVVPDLVLEVTYHTIDDRRLRYPARFVRLRPDRDARSCRFDQIAPAAVMAP